MSQSTATLGSSCATLQDGVIYLNHMDEEQDLLRQIQDRFNSTTKNHALYGPSLFQTLAQGFGP